MAGETPLGRMVIDVDLNTTKLNNSVTGLQRQMKMVNSAMTANLSSIGKYGSESDKLGTKIDGLNKKQKVQEAIVEEQAAAYQKVAKEKGENSKEAEVLASKLNKEQAKLSAVTSELDSANSELAEMERQNKILSSSWTKLGNSMDKAGSKLSSFGGQLKTTGSFLTRSITMPALGAITAVGGIVGAFGWGRLVSLDSAKAQLEGLGYSAKEVEDISAQVMTAIEGTTMTMGEGVSVAAGALAAGVEEGAELENYIKMVGNAAVGANRPIDEMATIFNRVEGSGRVMTEELNMIEDGMPGFSKKMADHMGVSLEAFRKMVTEGKVSSEDFMTVMEDHAGGMAEAYADTWQGMVLNTKAWIGILGENLLSGVFEQSKDSLNEFLGILSSEKAQEWATETGEKISTAFGKIINTVKGAITWFGELSSEQRRLMGVIAGLVVAAGPMLMAFGSFMSLLGNIFAVFSPVLTAIGKAGGLLKALGIAFGALTSPVGIAIGIIAAVGTGLVIAYNKSETFRNAVHNLGEKVRTAFTVIRDKTQEVWEKIKTFGDGIKNLFQGNDENATKILSSLGITPQNIEKLQGFRDKIIELKDKVIETTQQIVDRVKPGIQSVIDFTGEIVNTIKTMWQENSATIIPVVTNIGNIVSTVFSGILSFIQFIMPAVEFVIKMVWQNIQGVIKGGLKVIDGAVKLFSGIFTGDFSKMWEGVKNIFSGAIQLVWNGFQLLFYGRIIKGVGSLVKLFSGAIKGLWTKVTGFFKGMFDDAVSTVTNMKTEVVNFIKGMATGAKTTVKDLKENIQTHFKLLKENVTNRVKTLKESASTIFKNLKKSVGDTVRGLVTAVVGFFLNLFVNITNRVTNLRTKVSDTFNNLRKRVTDTVKNLISRVKDYFVNMYNNVTNRVSNLRNRASDLFSRMRNSVVNTVRNLIDRVKRFFSNMYNRVRNTVTNLKNNVVNLFNTIKDRVYNSARGMKDRAVDMFNTMKDKAKEKLDDLVQGAKDLPGKIKDAIVKGKNKAVDGIKELGNSMGSKLEETINGMIDGMNGILGKLGIKDLVDTINIPEFSTGTGASSSLTKNGAIAQDTLATVGDRGAGNGKGTRELVEYPNGTTGLYDNDATIFAPKGTIIHSNRQTEAIIDSLPQFSKGTGSGTKKQNTKEKKGAWGTLKDFATNAWDYIKNPSTIFNAMIDNLAPDFSGLKGFAGNVAKGGFDFIKGKALDWVTGIFKDNEGGLGKGKSAKFMNYRMTTPYSPSSAVPGYPKGFNGGRHYGIDYATPVGTPVHATMGGKVSKLHNKGGGLVAKLQSGDITQFFMHLSDIVKTGTVKAGELIAKTGNSGAWTTGAHIHWQAQKGSQIMNSKTVNPKKILPGFATGGLVGNGLYNLGEEGHPEWIIPTDPKRRTDAMKLLAYAGKSLQKNNGNLRPNNLPDIDTGNMSNNEIKELKEIVKNQQSQLEQNNQMIELMMKMVDKEYVALYDKKKMAKELEPEITKRTEYKNGREARLT